MEVIVIDKDMLWKLYWEEGLTQEAIGKIYNKSNQWVCKQMKKYKIPTKKTADIKIRFLYYIKIPENPNDCWKWVGFNDKDGYGKFKLNGKMMQAHRVSYILHIGEFDRTLCCLHKCDNPRCVNPEHLFIGTNEDNMKDRNQKGRSAKGERNGRSKLTEEEVKEIKSLIVQGISQNEIGILFKVTKENISSIKRGISWKHIGGIK